jgi:hypothetical protein
VAGGHKGDVDLAATEHILQAFYPCLYRVNPQTAYGNAKKGVNLETLIMILDHGVHDAQENNMQGSMNSPFHYTLEQ